jgi:hypothetical protein
MHDHSLRKGPESIELGYEHSCDTMGVVDARIAVSSTGHLVLKFDLKPVSENQRIDEHYLHSHRLKYVQLTDGRVIAGMAQYFKDHRDEVRAGIRLELTSLRKILGFDVTESEKQSETFQQLTISDTRESLKS